MPPIAFFGDKKKKVTSPVLRATLLSSSLDSWRRTDYRAPFYRPSETPLVNPLSIRRITPRFARAHEEAGYDYVRHLVCHEMRKCRHNRRDAFHDATVRQLTHDADEGAKALLLTKDAAKFDVAIDFDPDSDITTVTVCSIVYGTAANEADELICRAEPRNWPLSPGNFFKSVEPGRLVGERFQPDDSVLKHDKYQIQEHVEWNWAPQLESTGSMVNVLEIEKTNAIRDDKVALGYVEKVFKAVERKNDADPVAMSSETDGAATNRAREMPEYETSDLTQAHRIDYTYRLVRCMRSKFLSSWVPGGLDLDDGRYVAIWCPSKDGAPSAFLTTIQKRIHYSKAAEREAYPQFSQLLNLLAPAVITMLLKELAFNSTLSFIADLRAHLPDSSCLARAVKLH
jgi:hypothetical protein